MWWEHAKLSKAQEAELRELVAKLGVGEEPYVVPISEMLYLQAGSAIQGARFLLTNPKSWTLISQSSIF